MSIITVKNNGNKKMLFIIWEWLKDVLPAVLVALLLFKVIFGCVVVYGNSMNPSLKNGDLVIVQHILYTPERGDIVALVAPEYNKPRLIKRVIAIEGDTVDIDFDTGIVTLNGEILQEDYIAEPTYTNYGTEFPLTVEPGHVFVMGDNRNDSYDSRVPTIGQIDVDNIIGGKLFSIPLGK